MQSSFARLGFSRKYLLITGVFLVGLYVIVPQLHAFRSSWHIILHLTIGWTALAVGLTALTYAAAAGTYYFLAFKPLRYDSTVIVQCAAMFVNRLLPGGLGALGVNYTYLRRMKHSAAQAGSVVAINNLVGLLGHGLLLGLVLVVSGRSAAAYFPTHGRITGFAAKLTLVAIVLVLGLVLVFRHRLRQAGIDIRQNILSYRQRPLRLPGALLSSMLLTLCNVLCLSCCAHALGVSLPFGILLLIFTFGVGASTAIPTPGGLGGFEAALTAGIIAYHVSSPTALAVALLYRLVSYWLPLFPGAAALIICQKRRLFLL